MTPRVLCAVDFSDNSRCALRYAQAIAAWYDTELHVLHVPEERLPMTASSLAAAAPHAGTDIRKATTSALEAFVTETGCTRPVSKAVREGPTAAAIVDYAAEIQAELIVLGTHGRTDFDPLLLGATAGRVLNNAPCPVLSVPCAVAGPCPTERLQLKHVLCAVDFSLASMRALERGLSLAEENAAKVTVLHAIEVPCGQDPITDARRPLTEYLRLKTRDALGRLARVVPPGARASGDVSEIVRPGRPAQVILREAEARGADLIVMGLQGHSGSPLARFGSTTQNVVRRAKCPVLTSRAEAATVHAPAHATATARGR